MCRGLVILVIASLLYPALIHSAAAQDTYHLCDYIANNTQCVDPANNCQTIVEGTCHPQADCDATGLCFSKLTTNHATKVHVANYQQSCDEAPAFTLNLTLNECQVVIVFGHTFPTRVTRLDDTSAGHSLVQNMIMGFMCWLIIIYLTVTP